MEDPPPRPELLLLYMDMSDLMWKCVAPETAGGGLSEDEVGISGGGREVGDEEEGGREEAEAELWAPEAWPGWVGGMREPGCGFMSTRDSAAMAEAAAAAEARLKSFRPKMSP